MANHTTGQRRGQSGRPGSRPWHEDPEILARIERVGRLKAAGHTNPTIAIQTGTSVETVKADWAHLRELRRESAVSALEEHLENLRSIKQMIHGLIEDTDNRSLNIGQLVSQLRQIELDIAKLDGSYVQRTELSANGPVTFTLKINEPE